MYTQDLDTRNKVKEIFSYLLSIKNMNRKVIRNIEKYEKIYWESKLPKNNGCIIYKNYENEEWIEVTKKCTNLYNDLFKLYLHLEKNSENLEIIYGNGLLAWNINGEKILHPLITTKMELKFDAKIGKFCFKPYNNQTNMELDFLEELPIENLDKILEIKNNFKKLGIDPRNIDEMEPILHEISHYISKENIPKGKIQKKLVSLDDITPNKYPIFYNAPSIIIRRVDTRLWNLEFKNILNKIENNYPIPKTIQALTKEKIITQDKDNLNNWAKIGQDLLFPLPANEEQKEITKRLSENFGVVVQGPPGTGKSHTIVNLICHLLAHGKRILVTSQTDRALKVLSKKIPNNIRSLCISILGNDTKSLKELDESVRKITENLSINPEDIYKELSPLEKELSNCREEQQKLYSKLENIENIENKPINYNGKQHRLINMAKWTKENEKKYSWIKDNINPQKKCPLTNEEFKHLITLLENIDYEDMNTLNNITSIINFLPPYEKLIEDLNHYNNLKNNYNDYKKNLEGWDIPNDVKNIEEIIKILDNSINKLNIIEKSWLNIVMKYYYSSELSKSVWEQLISKCTKYVNDIGEIKSILNSHKIEIPESINIITFKKDFSPIYETLKSNKKLNTFFKIFHSNCKYILNNCKIDYNKITTIEQAEIVNLYIKQQLLKRDLKDLWNNTVKEYGGKLLNSSDTNLSITVEEYIKKIKLIMNWDNEFKNKIIQLLKNIHISKEINWYKKETYEYIKKGILSIKSLKKYYNIKNYIENIKKITLQNNKLKELNVAIENFDLNKINKIYSKIEELEYIKPKVTEINLLIDKLKSDCPLLIKDILTDKNLSIEKYNNLDEAWKWKQWKETLNKIHILDPDNTQQSLKEEKLREKQLIEELVGKKTWYNQIKRTSETQKRSLFAWMEAIKRIGKGTGKNAAKYRKIAQKEMENCKDVIPVWIMPLNRIIENLPISNNLFDVVIFDESSQSDLTAISALFRAEKAVIVGDEKQISPETIGKSNSKVETLINRYLKNIPHSEWFDLNTSLYNTALRIFPNRLLLKEHFRCVPEIIEFSNQLCYSQEILPLRCAENKEILTPPVVSIKVEDALRDNTKPINIKEAKKLVDQVVACCKNKKYKNMTMGVISLLGNNQAQLIEDMLTEKLGMEEIIKRKIICGDAYSFQGDERDIMFLSMVIAKNAKFTSLTKNSDIRRFNVAASRAKNQLWLFHSVDLEDLNPKCIRAKLLKYCLNPIKNSLDNKNPKYMLLTAFQKDVYTFIKKKDYKVIPNFKIGRYKIDFLVKGKKNKIAVLCNGDKWNDNYDWKKHYERQLNLEEIGWKFCTIRASEFYTNSTKAMEKLWDKLI